MKKLEMYYQCWLEVTKQPRYRDKWLTDESYFRAVKAQFPTLESLDFNRGKLNRAISTYGGTSLDDFTQSNGTGRFRRRARGNDPYDNSKRTIWGYYVTAPGGLVQRPPSGEKSFLTLLQDATLGDHYSVARGVPEIVDLSSEIAEHSSVKRKADDVKLAVEEAKKPRHGSDTASVVVESYWESPEAKKLFLGSVNDERNVVEVLEERVERLQQVNRTVDGWKDVVDKHDIDNLCSEYDIFIIRQRCSILCLAYIYALEEMNSARWVEDCCAQAIIDSSKMGIEAATHKRTVSGWNILLRSNNERFPLPNPCILKEKNPLPELLEYFQDEIMFPWVDYCITNLADLTVELAQNELVTKIIPNASAGIDNKNANETQIQESLLEDYLQYPISISTTWRWLRRLGFSYDTRKKSFFVDGHERQDVVSRRNEFCVHYLSKLEPNTHRWIQVTKETVETWKAEKKMLDDDTRGYHYTSPNNVEMVEFHIDNCDLLHDLADQMGFGAFGGNLSVRKLPDTKPLMIFGQDESVFNQFLLSNQQWVGPQGQRPLLPKTDGISFMVSALQSRETGFGVHISEIQFNEINEARRGRNYVDVDAAIAIHGQATKKDLKHSPFVVYFELGANNEGYWTYNHMAIQFEDCVDCLKVIYPQFDFAFLFDHSQGHAKKLKNGLDAYNMNKSYGGAQPKMRESVIKAEDGYLGMHEPRTVNVGDTQKFSFQPGDDGPFWMTEEERELNRHDRVLAAPPGNPPKRNKTIVELKLELGPLTILNDRRNYRLAELQEIARSHNIDTKIEKTRVKKGWEGQPKGLLQVLWERGWIDEGRLDRYTMDPATDEDGEVLEGAEEWSLRCLMASCLDFAEEMTALQHVGHELGVSVIITPKFHAELAGEGIEYSWGISKGVYRRKPLHSKKSKESFKMLVKECTSKDILGIKTVRKLSRRARAYICAYYTLYESKCKGDDTPETLTLPLIERLVKAFKTHRAAIDFDAAFVNGFVPKIEGV
jgi:hypothetical protein